jgi:hypothetical protein
MGHTKKGTRMKINEQLALMLNQTSQTNQPNQLNFEQWINTPTKQNSGDEYYWQHQDQLQQSSVQFNSQPLAHQQEKQETPEGSKLMVNPSPPEATISIPSQQKYVSYPLEKTDNNYLSAEELTKIIIDLEQELTQFMTPDGTANTPLKTDKIAQLKAIKTADYDQYNNSEIKNHHLFIQDQQVELTLNTQELNFKEQKALTQMMKHHLKNKGLILSKLIINGVHHD